MHMHTYFDSGPTAVGCSPARSGNSAGLAGNLTTFKDIKNVHVVKGWTSLPIQHAIDKNSIVWLFG